MSALGRHIFLQIVLAALAVVRILLLHLVLILINHQLFKRFVRLGCVPNVDFYKILWRDGTWPKDQLTIFWWRAGWQSRSIVKGYNSWLAAWSSGNIVGHINEVTLRRAGLVLRWVTVHGFVGYRLVFNQSTQVNSAWPSLRGWAQEYQRKLGRKQTHRAMHQPRIRCVAV